jgi:hypothetical protein
MIDAKTWLRKVVNDTKMFTGLYLRAEEKVLRKYPKGNDFGLGFLIGFWLGRIYGNEESNQGVCCAESGDRGRDS